MSVSPASPMNTVRAFRGVRAWFDRLFLFGSENEKGNQPEYDKRAYDGQNNSQNIHAHNLSVWSKDFKRGVASC